MTGYEKQRSNEKRPDPSGFGWSEATVMDFAFGVLSRVPSRFREFWQQSGYLSSEKARVGQMNLFPGIAQSTVGRWNWACLDVDLRREVRKAER